MLQDYKNPVTKIAGMYVVLCWSKVFRDIMEENWSERHIDIQIGIQLHIGGIPHIESGLQPTLYEICF